MNGLEAAVLVIIAVCALIGYYKGFLRVLYSLFAWIFVLALASWAAPLLADFLIENTNVKEVILNSEIFLPENIMKTVTGDGAAIAGVILESAGIYDEIADKAASFIIGGIMFFLVMVIGGIIMRQIAHVLDLAARLPGIKETNQALGAAAGAAKGLLAVWILFYMITLCGGGEFGGQMLYYIEESPFLSFLYSNNILLKIIMAFL